MTPKERAVVSIQNESETVSSLSMMRTVMKQALEALEELFHSNSTKVAVEKYNTAHNALREALEQPNEIDWIETNKALAKEIIDMKKQAEQEPVAWMSPNKERLEFSRKDTVYGSHTIPLYAAPVRTKDLTDAFINELHKDAQDPISFARAVIAADMELNK